jgi:hypothetical protein
MAGYSEKSLLNKLGVKNGTQVMVSFVHTIQELEDQFPSLKKSLRPDGMLWISWPKGSSKIPTDLNENVIRSIGLKNGLVDVKVAAVDDNYSGLKFVFRLKDRH